MRAALITRPGGPEVIRIENLSIPEPGEKQVRVKVAYSPMNPLDAHARAERIKWQHPGFPFTPGYEYAGIIDSVGDGVDASMIGNRVACNSEWGGCAEYAIANVHMVEVVPDEFSWHTAACYSTCAYTAWLLIHSAGKVKPGQSVLIHSAAGAVGALTTQVAKSAGATVFALAGGEVKLSYASQFGADYLIDYNDENWPEKVNKLSDGRGVDLIIDGNAGPKALKNLDVIAAMGNIIFMGASAGQAPEFNISSVIGKSCSISGFIKYFHQSLHAEMAKNEITQKLLSKEWWIPVEQVRPLDELADIHRAWEARELKGRTIIEVGGDL